MNPWSWPRKGLAGLVHAYRWTLKPWLGNACRFEPSCSAYALEALEQHGALAGTALTGWRLLRCHPWCDGGLDPVPARLSQAFAVRRAGPGLFTRLIPGDPTAGRPAHTQAQGLETPPRDVASGIDLGPSRAPHSLEPSRRGLRRTGDLTGELP